MKPYDENTRDKYLYSHDEHSHVCCVYIKYTNNNEKIQTIQNNQKRIINGSSYFFQDSVNVQNALF
jgi:hypothetical protein